jgi:hypothetical protein
MTSSQKGKNWTIVSKLVINKENNKKKLHFQQFFSLFFFNVRG